MVTLKEWKQICREYYDASLQKQAPTHWDVLHLNRWMLKLQQLHADKLVPWSAIMKKEEEWFLTLTCFKFEWIYCMKSERLWAKKQNTLKTIFEPVTGRTLRENRDSCCFLLLLKDSLCFSIFILWCDKGHSISSLSAISYFTAFNKACVLRTHFWTGLPCCTSSFPFTLDLTPCPTGFDSPIVSSIRASLTFSHKA